MEVLGEVLAELPPAAVGQDLITLDRVSYAPGAVARVRDVSLRIAAGEIVALAGASGAGKTTLVDLMTGSAEPHQRRDRGARRASERR